VKKVLALFALLLLAAAAPAADLKVGARAPDFTLPAALDGKAVVLKDLLATHKAVEGVRNRALRGDLLYHGRIDESRDDPKGVKSPDLRNALDAILASKPVPVAETEAFGCSIKRV
jgi:hypothetical protein